MGLRLSFITQLINGLVILDRAEINLNNVSDDFVIKMAFPYILSK